MLRILFLSDCPFIPNSLGKISYYLTRGLIERGFEVYNVCPAGTTTLWSTGLVYNPGLSCHDPVIGRCSDDLVMVVYPWNGSLKPLVRWIEPDVILLFGTPYAPPLHEALKECYSMDIPCVGYFDNESLLVIPEYALHAANATLYASPTEFARRSIEEGLVASGIEREVVRERSYVVYHGVDIDLYTRSRPEPLFGDNVFTYGTFSKNHIRKNMAVLLHAYSILPEEVIRRSRLFMALIDFGGGGEWKVDLLIKYVEMLSGRRIKDNVVGLDQYERARGITEYQVLRIYASMDVFVFPSEGESFGLPPVEAALMGKPVIVTDHPALKEIWSGLPSLCIVPGSPYILPEAFGLVKPDVGELTKALETMFYDEKLRKYAAWKAKEIAMKYDWRKMVDGITKLVEEADKIGAKPISRSGGKKQ